MLWNSIAYPPMSIGKDKPGVSVSNAKKGDSLMTVHNTMKIVTPTITNHNKGNTNNEGWDASLPLKPLPNIQKTKELTLPLPEYKNWIHKSQKHPPCKQPMPLKRFQIFFTAEGK